MMIGKWRSDISVSVLVAVLLIVTSSMVTHAQGQMWRVSTVLEGATCWDVDAVDSSRAFIAANYGARGVLFRTTDGGLSWDTLYSVYQQHNAGAIPRILGVVAIDSNRLVMCSDSGLVSSSSDGGRSWRTTQVDTGKHSVTCVAMSTSGLGAAAVRVAPNFLSVTRDGGLTWAREEIPYPPEHPSMGITDVVVVGTNTIVCLAEYGDDRAIVRSTDQGTTWTSWLLSVPGLSRLSAFDSTRYCAVGKVATGERDLQRAIVALTGDGGATWDVIMDSVIADGFGLEDVDFSDERHGLAVGGPNIILRTADGGRTWGRDTSDIGSGVARPWSVCTGPTRGIIVTTFARVAVPVWVTSGVSPTSVPARANGPWLSMRTWSDHIR